MNTCQYCQAPSYVGQIACSKCAAPLPTTFNMPVQQVAPFPAAYPRQQYKVTEMTLKDLGIYLAVIMGVICFILGAMYYMDWANKKTLTSRVTTPVSAPYTLEDSGELADLKYTLSRKGEKTVALFLPKMIPRNDEWMILATTKVINHAYGERVVGRPKADGIHIVYPGETHKFSVTIIKEDTGEIHTLVIERK
jgi:hypothetical protein